MLWDCATTFTSEPLSLSALTGPLGTEGGPQECVCVDGWSSQNWLEGRSRWLLQLVPTTNAAGGRARPPTPSIFPCNVNFESAGTKTHPSPSQRQGAEPRRTFWVTIHKFHPRMPWKDVLHWCAGAVWTPWNVMVYTYFHGKERNCHALRGKLHSSITLGMVWGWGERNMLCSGHRNVASHCAPTAVSTRIM